MNRVCDSYPFGECPDCGEEIPEDAEDGHECIVCGHVLFAEKDEDEDGNA